MKAELESQSPAFGVLDMGAFLMRSVRRWKIAAGILGGLVVIAAVISLTLPNTYSVTTKLVFQGGGGALSGGLSTLASLAGVSGNVGGSDPSLYFEDVALSTGLLQAVLDRAWKGSASVEDTSASFLLRDFWGIKVDSNDPGWKDALRESLQRRLVDGKYLKVSTDKKTGVISVITRFEDPLLSLQVNQFVVERANEILVHKMSTSAGENRKFIEGRIKEIKQDLADAEGRYQSFLEGNRVRSSPELQVQEVRLQRSLQINQEVYLQLVKQLEMAKIDEAKDLPVLDQIDQPLLPVKKSGPNRKMFVLAALLLGGVTGIFWAAMWDVYAEDRKGFLRRVVGFFESIFRDRTT